MQGGNEKYPSCDGLVSSCYNNWRVILSADRIPCFSDDGIGLNTDIVQGAVLVLEFVPERSFFRFGLVKNYPQ